MALSLAARGRGGGGSRCSSCLLYVLLVSAVFVCIGIVVKHPTVVTKEVLQLF